MAENETEAASQYPEHEKLAAVKDDAQTIGEFLEWFQSEEDGVLLQQFDEAFVDIEDVLYAFFKVDKAKLEAEKEAMLDAYEEANNNGS